VEFKMAGLAVESIRNTFKDLKENNLDFKSDLSKDFQINEDELVLEAAKVQVDKLKEVLKFKDSLQFKVKYSQDVTIPLEYDSNNKCFITTKPVIFEKGFYSPYAFIEISRKTGKLRSVISKNKFNSEILCSGYIYFSNLAQSESNPITTQTVLKGDITFTVSVTINLPTVFNIKKEKKTEDKKIGSAKAGIVNF